MMINLVIFCDEIWNIKTIEGDEIERGVYGTGMIQLNQKILMNCFYELLIVYWNVKMMIMYVQAVQLTKFASILIFIQVLLFTILLLFVITVTMIISTSAMIMKLTMTAMTVGIYTQSTATINTTTGESNFNN